jgi:hypothetical protein
MAIVFDDCKGSPLSNPMTANESLLQIGGAAAPQRGKLDKVCTGYFLLV